MYSESEYNKDFSVRSLLLKIFLILIIIILLIWIVPKFLSYKKKPKTENKTEKVAQVEKIKTSAINKLEKAGLKYFKEDNVPNDENKDKKITLSELKKENIVGDIKNGTTTCNANKSYVLLTKENDDYVLKTYLKCGSEDDYVLSHVGKYDYCHNTYLCKKDETQEDKKEDVIVKNDDNNKPAEEENKEETKTNPTPKTKTLSEFSSWKAYEKTSCDTKEVTCGAYDTNCLTEVKLYTRKELVGTKTVTHTTEHTALKYVKTESKKVCSDYNYVVISNNIFKTKGNYGEILNLGKQSTSNWTYRGQVTTTTTPSFGGNEYYKYVGTSSGSHYYDSYKYNYSMEKVGSYTQGCSSTTTKPVNIYTVYKQAEQYNTKENVYATACYKSVRTRTYE